MTIFSNMRQDFIQTRLIAIKILCITRGISHGWVRVDSTSRISSQPQFRSDCLKTSFHERIIWVADFKKNKILKSQRLNFTF